MDDEYRDLLERVMSRSNLLEDDIESISEIMESRPEIARALEAQDFHVCQDLVCLEIF